MPNGNGWRKRWKDQEEIESAKTIVKHPPVEDYHHVRGKQLAGDQKFQNKNKKFKKKQFGLWLGD